VSTAPGDAATVCVTVAVEPTIAFEVFTEEIDRWWRRGPRYRGRNPGSLVLEPRLGGRVFEQGAERSLPLIERGVITQWEPPGKLAFRWHVPEALRAPGHAAAMRAVDTLVQVWFEAVPGGTQVTVRHSGWAAVPAEHPARHGALGLAMSRRIGLWWGELLSALREELQGRC